MSACENLKVERCPQCGAPAQLSARRCGYCEAEFIVTSLASLDRIDRAGIQKYVSHYRKQLADEPDSGELHLAMGICHLDLGLHDLAAKSFAKAIETQPENPDNYYYQALAIIKGRKPKLLSLKEVREIENHLAAAVQLDPGRAVYRYLLLAVKYEFYLKNGLRVPPPSIEEILSEAKACERASDEMARLLSRVPIQDEGLLKVLSS
jgi:tetratricopeptide (TPR) repeat protein